MIYTYVLNRSPLGVTGPLDGLLGTWPLRTVRV